MAADSFAGFIPSAEQQSLLNTIYWCATKEKDHEPAESWGAWGYICHLMDSQDLDADFIVRGLPSVPHSLYSRYGLIWRSQSGTIDITSTETVGLTMAGLRLVDVVAADRIAQMLAGLAEAERRLIRAPREPTRHTEPLNPIVERFMSPSSVEPRVGMTTMTPVAVGQMLRREPFLMVLPTSDELIFEVEFGERRLRHLRGIIHSGDYLIATLTALSSATPQVFAQGHQPGRVALQAVRLDGSALHPWVWEAAQSRWASGHFGDALQAAAKRINAELQTKVGRKDVSETALFQQAFTLEPPEPGKARLRRAPADDGQTYRNLHLGAIQFAGGLFQAVRNPIAHEAAEELTEQEALEVLTAFSVLARWVDDAEVVHATSLG